MFRAYPLSPGEECICTGACTGAAASVGEGQADGGGEDGQAAATSVMGCRQGVTIARRRGSGLTNTLGGGSEGSEGAREWVGWEKEGEMKRARATPWALAAQTPSRRPPLARRLSILPLPARTATAWPAWPPLPTARIPRPRHGDRESTSGVHGTLAARGTVETGAVGSTATSASNPG